MATVFVFLAVICAWAWYFAVQSAAMRHVNRTAEVLTRLEASLETVRCGVTALVPVLTTRPAAEVPRRAQQPVPGPAGLPTASARPTSVPVPNRGTPMTSPRRATPPPPQPVGRSTAQRRFVVLVTALLLSAGILLAAAVAVLPLRSALVVPVVLGVAVAVLRWDVVREARRRAEAEAQPAARPRRVATGAQPVVSPASGAIPVVPGVAPRRAPTGSQPVVAPGSASQPVAAAPVQGASGMASPPVRPRTGPIPVIPAAGVGYGTTGQPSGAMPVVGAPAPIEPVTGPLPVVGAVAPELRGRTDWATQSVITEPSEEFSRPLYSSHGDGALGAPSGAIPVVPAPASAVPPQVDDYAFVAPAEPPAFVEDVVEEPITGSMQGIPTDDINTWQPAPIPPPMYSMKAKASPRTPPPVVPDASSVTPDAYEAYGEDLHHRRLNQRRASGQ